MSWVFNPPNCSSTCFNDNDGGFDDYADNSNDITMIVMLMIMELKKEFSNPPKSSSRSHMCSNKPDALGLHVGFPQCRKNGKNICYHRIIVQSVKVVKGFTGISNEGRCKNT